MKAVVLHKIRCLWQQLQQLSAIVI